MFFYISKKWERALRIALHKDLNSISRINLRIYMFEKKMEANILLITRS